MLNHDWFILFWWWCVDFLVLLHGGMYLCSNGSAVLGFLVMGYWFTLVGPVRYDYEMSGSQYGRFPLFRPDPTNVNHYQSNGTLIPRLCQGNDALMQAHRLNGKVWPRGVVGQTGLGLPTQTLARWLDEGHTSIEYVYLTAGIMFNASGFEWDCLRGRRSSLLLDILDWSVDFILQEFEWGDRAQSDWWHLAVRLSQSSP